LELQQNSKNGVPFPLLRRDIEVALAKNAYNIANGSF
jgi:hypothetical protein